MSEDTPENQQSGKTWLEKISQAFAGDPKNASELVELLRTAETRGVLDPDSMSIIEGAMQVTDMQVREIMIPRSQMTTIRSSQEPTEFMGEVIDSAHSRFPVLGDDPDDVIGILLAKDLLNLMWQGKLKKEALTDYLRPATFVPESKRLNKLLKEFKTTRNHMAIVIDEYGGVAGLVTIEDVLEQIVGEIEDEHDYEEDTLIKPRSESEFIVKSVTPMDEFNEFFGTELDEEEFDTIGGLVMKNFGRVPKRNENIKFGGLKFTILNADNRTIRLLQVNKL
ncbi:HCC family transporter [Oleiphilus messinensis]|uniref:Magnesium and cobalt efflux protein CorC n=1 Tax=Oleiphilus messinensis TaxID=141451 RepID=A0A1Y0I622_9GAMM|nr:transporter associated domain-containing protein [Oleiphilus messinensis]ARU55938.1 HCC family transporter [Oleiphilus messinensis]